MTRITSAFGWSVCASALVALSAISGVSAHGYLSSPSPRGIQKVSYQIDDLKSPNTKGICRGESAGKVTNVGHSVTLGFTITAPHIGMCEVYILDENLGNARKIASKDGCAAPGKVGPWTVNIPSDISGRKVLRWVWNAAHLVTTIEHYEQCADINISGGGGGGSGSGDSDNGSTDGGSDTTTPATPDDKGSSKGGKGGKGGKSGKGGKKSPDTGADTDTGNDKSDNADADTDTGNDKSTENKSDDADADTDTGKGKSTGNEKYGGADADEQDSSDGKDKNKDKGSNGKNKKEKNKKKNKKQRKPKEYYEE
ncbi:hypothetical protein BDF22DRAFT_740653 [Syncephalis plumigaleata]|nr:hypothetical protein BDF22DRAFT_740653 [Syncephalis plumigaleata]